MIPGKLEQFKTWARQKRIYSTVDIKNYGNENYFTSVDVRCRIDLKTFHRRIPVAEARTRGLIKPGAALIAWYEVTEGGGV